MQIYEHGPWIDGSVAPTNGMQFMMRSSPADGRDMAKVWLGTEATVDRAVQAAKKALRSWSAMSGAERGKALARFADVLETHSNDLSYLETDESGKAITQARGEVQYSIELIRYAASLAWNLTGKSLSDDGANRLGMVLREPRGVVGLILPWNYPMVCLMQKLPFALAAGCTVVVKPSELTSGTTVEVARVAGEAGLPNGLVNVVTGTGETVGEAITRHPDIAMVSFTGSTRVGRTIAARSAEKLTPVALELGGKGANIVFADADLDAAVDGALAGFTINKGEECCAGGRILVQDSIADEFVAKLSAKAQNLRVGPPRDETTEMGPLISEEQLQKVMGYIDSGVSEGAKIVFGGRRLTDGGMATGCYLAPTLFSDVSPDMKIASEEIFGPVAAIFRFKTRQEAIDLANATSYGLANGVWTSNLDTAMAVVRGMKSGMVYVNTYLETIPQLPFGGMKNSGIGRENGIEGLEEFLETKAAFIRLNP
jgi:acyl-CoA reductase-like NAD-dependent aldehyde dehydrogenase